MVGWSKRWKDGLRLCQLNAGAAWVCCGKKRAAQTFNLCFLCSGPHLWSKNLDSDKKNETVNTSNLKLVSFVWCLDLTLTDKARSS